jgi:hypothetical protein
LCSHLLFIVWWKVCFSSSQTDRRTMSLGSAGPQSVYTSVKGLLIGIVGSSPWSPTVGFGIGTYDTRMWRLIFSCRALGLG